MKLLIAYDGSPCSDAALDDLVKAGLPPTGEAHVVSVAEVWLPPSDGINGTVSDERIESMLGTHRRKGEEMMNEARKAAGDAAQRLERIVPDWKVSSSATYGSPAWEILAASESYGADLIVVGSQGQSTISRAILGSISQKVLTEAACSVRIARGKNEVEPSAVRVVIGFDSTKGAEAAVAEVARRNWPAGTIVRLVTAIEDAMPTMVGLFVPAVGKAVSDINESEHAVLSELAVRALARLRDAGVSAEMHIVSGSAKNAVVDHAEEWDADSIFVGANAFGSRLERFLIGSTSSAIATRAHCSVEVIRVRS